MRVTGAAVGHRSVLHGCVVCAPLDVPGHEAPSFKRSWRMVAVWVPPPQVTLHSLQAEMTQSTGHGCELHGCVRVRAGQAAPPLAAGVNTVAVEICPRQTQRNNSGQRRQQKSKILSARHTTTKRGGNIPACRCRTSYCTATRLKRPK